MTYPTREQAIQAAQAVCRHYVLCHTAWGWSFAIKG